jgi:ectoine hydroxylase-related dioxygenase (phytanoyl-CoA dioxygenase family)
VRVSNQVAVNLKAKVDQAGFAVIPECLDELSVDRLCEQFDKTQDSQRNILSLSNIRQLAASKPVREIVELVLGPKCFAVRGIFFNKTIESNWKVVWHQDLTIAVRQRKQVKGFGPWSTKAGVLHVQPPAEVLSAMLAIRLHLDESGPDNAPLRVIGGSHKEGRLSADQIAGWEKGNCEVCTVLRGGALLMRPLLLHASSICALPKPRRVIHFEFASCDLPDGLDWQDKV